MIPQEDGMLKQVRKDEDWQKIVQKSDWAIVLGAR